MINLNESWVKGVKNGRRLIFYAIPPYKFDYEPLRGEIKRELILISGFLQRFDHKVGLLHSDFDVYLFEKKEEEDFY